MPREVNLGKLNRKLSALTKSKDSIQSLSLWIIRHKAFRDEIAEEWLKAVRQADLLHRLTLFYLANDVLQNCKRKDAAEYRSSFAEVLENALSYARDKIIKDEVLRLIYIWRERNVFSPVLLKLFQAQVNKEEPTTTEDCADSSCLTEDEILKNFDANKFIVCLRQLSQPCKKVHEKSNNSDVLSDDEIDRLNFLDIRINCDVRKMYDKLEATSKFLEEKVEKEHEINRKHMKVVEIAQTFYSSQYDDVRRVVQAYKIFGKKLNKVKDALSEKMKTLPSPIDISSYAVKTVPNDGVSPSLIDKTYTGQEQQGKDQGIAIDTHLSFFDQGIQFSNIVADEKENKKSKSAIFRGEEEKQTPTKMFVAPEVATVSSEFKTQKECQPKKLDRLSPKHKRMKIEPSIVELSPKIKMEVEDVKPEKPNPMISKMKTQETKHQPKELNQTSRKRKIGSVSETGNQLKMSNLISPKKAKTDTFKQQSNKPELKSLKQEVKTKPIIEIDLTSPKKSKTEVSLVKQKSKELENDLEIIPPPKLRVEASRKGFKPIKLNLISSPKPKNKEIEHQPKGLNLELLNAKVENEPNEVSQGLTIETEIDCDVKEVNQESFSKIEIKSEKIESEESFKIPLIEGFDLNSVKLENEALCTKDDCAGTSKTGDDKNIQIRESGKLKENFPSVFKQSDEETLSMIFREDEILQTMKLDEPIDACVKTESCGENSKPLPVSVCSTVLLSSEEDSLPSNILLSTEQVPVASNITSSTKEVSPPSNITPSAGQVPVASNILLNTKQVSVPSNIPPSTKQSLLKSMKILNILLSKKKKVDSKIDSADQQSIFPLNTMFPIFSHNFRSVKSNYHPVAAEESEILPSQKSVRERSRHCDAKSEKVDSNLELMDMDLDSEDDS